LQALKQQVQAEMAQKMKGATTKEDLENIQKDAEKTSKEEMSKMLNDRNNTEEEKQRILQVRAGTFHRAVQVLK
jgi:hypothetical protein